MSGTSRIDRLAMRLARPDAQIYALDGVARRLATPVTRRRAVTLIGTAVAAGSLLRPSRARAQNCWPGGPKICSNSKGARVCVPENLACCSNDNCAIACPYPWRICESAGNCADTASMCTDPAAAAPGNTLFCSKRVTVTNGCMESGTSESIRGWCCNPVTEECGEEFGECRCRNECGDDCCGAGEECVNLGLFEGGEVCLPRCNPGWHHDGKQCVCDFGHACGIFCCPPKYACDGDRCVAPPGPRLPSSSTMGSDAGNQAAAASDAGAQKRSAVAVGATGAVGAALLAFAAVNAQGVAALEAFDETRVDRAYRRRVVAPRVSPPRIPADAGLSPEAARALETLLAAEARGFALALACATALARSRGALHKRDMGRARRHVAAAAGFARRAAKTLAPVPALRGRALRALQSSGAAEVVATAAEIASMQAGVRAHGVPPELRRPLRRLGVRGHDLAPVRAALLAGVPGGPALIEPLADPSRTRTLKAISTGLARFSKSARRRPLERVHGKPKRYTPRAKSTSRPR
jgi:hypothetical protein